MSTSSATDALRLLPSEVWTDIFMPLSRRILLQSVQPMNPFFNDICNKNVKSVHVIRNADKFTEKLAEADPEAMQQLEHLADPAARHCQLAGQFRLLNKLWICDERSKAILLHCTDLFNGCQISWSDASKYEERGEKTTFLDQCLDILEPTKPAVIDIFQIFDKVNPSFWHHPIVLSCNRIRISNWDWKKSTFMDIFDWLHHQQPAAADSGDGGAISADDQPEKQQQVRCMIFWQLDEGFDHYIPLLLDRCIKALQNSRAPSDRRQFVLSFVFYHTGVRVLANRTGRIENKATGEVLVLERVREKRLSEFYREEAYRLRRCLAQEVAAGEEFYSKIFMPDLDFFTADCFEIDWEVTAEVLIE